MSHTSTLCRHGKRKVITPEDVKLCCRRNAELVNHHSNGAHAVMSLYAAVLPVPPQVDLVSCWHDNLKSQREAAVAPQGDKGKGGRGKGRKVVLEDSDSDTDT